MAAYLEIRASRSACRTNGDTGLIRIISEHAVEIVELREKIEEKSRYITNLEMRLQELAAKDAEIARLKREIASMTEKCIECGNFASGDYGVICENCHFRS